MSVPSPIPIPTEITVVDGPAVLAGVGAGPGLATHRERFGPVPDMSLSTLAGFIESARVTGRGGAGFPFVIKLRAAASGRKRPVVVVNLSEGEPPSGKDTALALTRPHLVLDGATLAAHALGTREVHVVLPGDRPRAAAAVEHAVAERADGIEWQTRVAEPRFVAGQARAVLELLAGRPNLPVTAWKPEAFSGHQDRPTLLSNGETFAHVGLLGLRGPAAYQGLGTTTEPGTTLLTISEPSLGVRVEEVPYGTRWRDLLTGDLAGRDALIGGFHGSWARAETLRAARVSVGQMRALGIPLGAGVVYLPARGQCPLDLTAAIVNYLADQSARRCGPCFNGLPALAQALRGVRDGTASQEEVRRLAQLVRGRGACAHPDGTARLVSSCLATFADEVSAHVSRRCPARAAAAVGGARPA